MAESPRPSRIDRKETKQLALAKIEKIREVREFVSRVMLQHETDLQRNLAKLEGKEREHSEALTAAEKELSEAKQKEEKARQELEKAQVEARLLLNQRKASIQAAVNETMRGEVEAGAVLVNVEKLPEVVDAQKRVSEIQHKMEETAAKRKKAEENLNDAHFTDDSDIEEDWDCLKYNALWPDVPDEDDKKEHTEVKKGE